MGQRLHVGNDNARSGADRTREDHRLNVRGVSSALYALCVANHGPGPKETPTVGQDVANFLGDIKTVETVKTVHIGSQS